MGIVSKFIDKQKHLEVQLSVLDDLKMIHERDAQDALGIAAKQYVQLGHQFEVVPRIEPGSIRNVVYAGMGGSALAASLATTCLSIAVPFEVIRDYTLPAYVGGETLVIVASYSGNTEEAMSALGMAEQKGSRVAVIAGGIVPIAEQPTQHYVFPPAVDYRDKCCLHGLLQLYALSNVDGIRGYDDGLTSHSCDLIYHSVEVRCSAGGHANCIQAKLGAGGLSDGPKLARRNHPVV